ncbi:hypothetical protein HMPREF9123_0101 [Neisseria bacilliformis ATCC BAA-1200]|uniref:Uncharacterized protein n=1 Tax=Neisseria bacilliformis ATCC BAA-1200 TaxID=888742 RepID=F2B8P8_9NEIS|nr:hypothetical protein HMPREF9123_0101 [Neisseria bacilliformis ATCC BAA-1200]
MYGCLYPYRRFCGAGFFSEPFPLLFPIPPYPASLSLMILTTAWF